MKRSLLVLSVLSAMPCMGQFSAPLTIQEALYPGSINGVTRVSEPFCMGVPIADSAGITSTSSMSLSGITSGQFRILGRWPDGNAKWVKVCGVVPSLSAAFTASTTLISGGQANASCGSSDATCYGYGGGNLAADNGATITINTGAATFSIKKAHFNGLDSVTVGSTTVISSTGTTYGVRGLMLTGPSPSAGFPGNVTCSPETGGSSCTTVYSSDQDANSTASIIENGPVRTVIKAIGTHKDGSGNPYMQFTAYLTFDVGKTYAQTKIILRNANYDTSATPSADCNPNPNNGQCQGGTFNSAFKGIRSYELRVSPNLGTTVAYTIAGQNYTTGSGSSQANPGTLLSGTLTGTDSAYIYQGQSNWLEESDVSGNTCDIGTTCLSAYTTDVGYVAKKNGTILASDATGHAVVGGWMDCANNASGLGVEIGVDQFSSMFPVSLECNGGGSDVRIGLLSGKNSKNVYMPWPQWKTFETFLNFHAAALNSPAGEFLKYQHYLLARPSVPYLNATGAMWYQIPTASDEDAMYVSAKTQASPTLNGTWQNMLCWSGGTSNCFPDRGVSDNVAINDAAGLGIARYHSWGDGGSLNQGEFRYGDMLKFLQRGQTGRFLNSRYFFRYMDDLTVPHDDGITSSDSTINGFTWRSRPQAGQAHAELNGFGQPVATFEATTNNSYGFGEYVDHTPQWRDSAHDHWYGLPDYYFLTGDDSVADTLVLQKNWFLNQNTYQYGIGANNLQSARAWGIILSGTAIYGTYLSAIGDTAGAAAVLATGQHNFDSYINVRGCVGGIWNGTMQYLPAGCTVPPVATTSNADPTGVSLERGVFQMEYRGGSGWCSTSSGGTESGMTGNYRFTNTFQNGILTQGILDFRKGMGRTWTNYNRALDLAMGLSQATMAELLQDNGQSYWRDPSGTSPSWLFNGFAYSRLLDLPSQCPATTTVNSNIMTYSGTKYDSPAMVNGSEGHYGIFVPLQASRGTASLNRIFNISLQQSSGGTTAYPGDFGMQYIGEYIAAATSGNNNVLQDVNITSLAYLGGGVYQLGFTTPAGTCTNDPSCLRVKWSDRAIQKDLSYLLNFNNLTNTFGMDPTANVPWFGANNVWPEASPTPGTPQTFNVTTTDTTGTWTTAHFSIKAMAPGGSSGSGQTLTLLSGNSQTGTVGLALGSPLVVAVRDASGNPVAGVTVNFSITGGGGTLNPTSVSTNALGMASSVLTLGSAAGVTTVSASAGGLSGSPVTFTATGVLALTGVATNLSAVSGSGQSGSVGQPLANAFVVKVTDSTGNPVSGTTVLFTVSAGGGSLSVTSATSDSSGLASSRLTLGASAGSNTVLASSGSLQGSPITFTATGVGSGSTPANLVLVSGNNQTGTIGRPVFSPLVVEVVDGNGNPVPGVGVSFSVSAGGGTVSATNNTTNSAGISSTILTLGQATGQNAVRVTSSALPALAVTFNATGFMPYDLNGDGVVDRTDVGIAIDQSVSKSVCGNADVNLDGLCNVLDVQLEVAATLPTQTIATSPNGPTVVWSNPTSPTQRPSFAGWNMVYMDPVSGLMLVYAGPGGTGTSIYSTDVWEWNATANSWTHIAGTGSTADTCTIDSPNLPGDRHPGWQSAIDTRRMLWWQYGGVDQICAGAGVSVSGSTVTFVAGNHFAANWAGASLTIAGTACTSASPCTVAATPAPTSNSVTLTTSPGNVTYTSGNCPGASGCLALTDPGNQPTRLDMYYLTLNANPVSDTWTRVSPPSIASSSLANQSAGMVYDPDDDALVVVGAFNNGNVGVWKYYPTVGNAGNALTAAQVASGATTANDWIVEFNAANGATGACTTDNTKGPQGTHFPGVVYSSTTKLLYAYGGANGADTCFFNQLWAYNPGGSVRQGIAPHTWAKLCAGSCVAPPADAGAGTSSGQPALAYNPNRQSILYHHIGNNGTAADYEYLLANDTWSLLNSTGTGPSQINGANMTFDAVNNRLLAWTSGSNLMWIGALQ